MHRHLLERVTIFFGCLAFLVLHPCRNALGDTSLTISASTAAKIALSAAGQYTVKHNNQWAHYETLMVLSVLTEAGKAAANAGQPITSAQYDAIRNQTQSFLDSLAQPAQKELSQDAAHVIRYATDQLFSMSTNIPGVGPLLAKAVDALGKQKINDLENKLDSSLQTLADQQINRLAGQATKFLGDRFLQAFDVMENDQQLASIANPILFGLLHCDTTCSFSDVKNLFQNQARKVAVVPDGSPNPDGTFTFDLQATGGLMDQYDGVIRQVRDNTGSDIQDLREVSDYQLLSFFPGAIVKSCVCRAHAAS